MYESHHLFGNFFMDFVRFKTPTKAMNFGEAKLTVSAMVIEDTRNMCGNLHPNSVSRVIFSGFGHPLAPSYSLASLCFL